MRSRSDAAKQEEAGRPSNHTADYLLPVFLGDQDLLSSELKAQCNRAGIGDTMYYELFAELKKSGRVHKSALDRKWEKVEVRKQRGRGVMLN